MWIKKLDLGVLNEYYQTGYNSRYDPNIGYVRGKAIFSTKTRAFTFFLAGADRVQIHPIIYHNLIRFNNLSA